MFHHVVAVSCLLWALIFAILVAPATVAAQGPHTKPPAQLEVSALFDDLRPGFEKLQTGATVNEAVALMGQPTEVEATEYLGVSIQTVTWRSVLRGQTFVARFVLGRLASKSLIA